MFRDNLKCFHTVGHITKNLIQWITSSIKTVWATSSFMYVIVTYMGKTVLG